MDIVIDQMIFSAPPNRTLPPFPSLAKREIVMDLQWRKKWEREEDEEGLDETGVGGVCTLQSKYDFSEYHKYSRTFQWKEMQSIKYI